MNCSKCNAENPQGAQFCSECGAELSAIPGFAKFREIVRKRSKIAFRAYAYCKRFLLSNCRTYCDCSQFRCFQSSVYG
ncbi:MAG: zinc-ribbon domain-containing protein [Bacteroidales bacterium]|nr:zinc-ribbon domain-containing protein [Bacteroidales bacterium]